MTRYMRQLVARRILYRSQTKPYSCWRLHANRPLSGSAGPDPAGSGRTLRVRSGSLAGSIKQSEYWSAAALPNPAKVRSPSRDRSTSTSRVGCSVRCTADRSIPRPAGSVGDRATRSRHRLRRLQARALIAGEPPHFNLSRLCCRCWCRELSQRVSDVFLEPAFLHSGNHRGGAGVKGLMASGTEAPRVSQAQVHRGNAGPAIAQSCRCISLVRSSAI